MKKRIYNKWAGNPKGTPENPTRCVKQVWQGGLGCQCERKRGHDPDGLYCKQHAKIILRRRKILK